MVLWFRTIWVVMISLVRSKMDFQAEARSKYCVRLIDTDFPHFDGMSNGRYFNVMDLARVELVIRAGLLRPMLKNGWFILVGGQSIRYHKTLKRWQRYEVRSQVIGWDDKWFYVSQRFERKGELHAIGVVRALFRDKRGNVAPKDVVTQVGISVSPPLRKEIKNWVEEEKSLLGEGR